jgi:urease accessory protein
VHAMTPRVSDQDLQRATGCGRIVLSGSENGTHIVDIFQRSPIRIVVPKVNDGALKEVVLVNTAGGIAGGDQLEFSVTALPSASIAVSSQAAEKVYRALSEPARINTQLRACAAAKLAWLPQETIVFNRARIIRKTEIEISPGAEVLALEWLVIGRAAHGEVITGGHISDDWRVKKDGRLIWAEGFRITDEVFAQLHRKALLSNCKAVAKLVYFGPDLDIKLKCFRHISPRLECHCAATLVGGLLIIRFAAAMLSDLGLALRNVLQLFSRDTCPGPFRVPKLWSCCSVSQGKEVYEPHPA